MTVRKKRQKRDIEKNYLTKQFVAKLRRLADCIEQSMLSLSACLYVRMQTGRLTALHSGFLHLPVGRQGRHLAMTPS